VRSRLARLPGAILLSIGLIASFASPAEAVVSDRPARGVTFNGPVRVVLSTGSVTYIGGEFTAARTPSGVRVPRSRLAAVDTRTGRLLSFNPRVDGPVWALARSGTDLYVGGVFSRVGGKSRKNIAEVRANASVTRWQPRMNSRVRTLDAVGGTLYAGGQFTRVNRTPRARLASFRTATGELTGWRPRLNAPVSDLVATKSRLYVAGHFRSVNGNTSARFLTAFAGRNLARGWNPRVDYPVNGLAVQRDSVYAAAYGRGGHLRAFRTDNANNRWSVTADGNLKSVTVMGDAVYFGGHMTQICNSPRVGMQGACLDGGRRRSKLAAVGVRNGALLRFSPQANESAFEGVQDLDSVNGVLSVGGVFTSFKGGSIVRPRFARFL
jgi:hypothetical protein